MPSDPAHQRAAARVAILARWRDPNDPELVAARQALAVARLDARIAQAVANAPARLTREQKDRLVALLPPAPGEDGVADA